MRAATIPLPQTEKVLGAQSAESNAFLTPTSGKICAAIVNSGVAAFPRGLDTFAVLDESGLRQSTEVRCEACPLTCVRVGMAVRIRKLCADPAMQERLREIGLCEDQVIRLVTNRTNFICQVCNARLALSQQLAQLIWVEPVMA